MDARTKERLYERAEILKAIASPVRLFVVEALAGGECPVHVLAEAAGVREATMSRHLSRLKKSGILECRKTGNPVLYYMRTESVKSIRESVETILTGNTSRSKALCRTESRQAKDERRIGPGRKSRRPL